MATTHKWDTKSNYMLAFTICKHGSTPDRWTSIAQDLDDHISTTPQLCKIQFEFLCQQYAQDWQSHSSEPLHVHVFSTIKRLYYNDLCERMTESRDLLMVMYDFIRLFKGGLISPADVNEILQDVKNTTPETSDNEQQQKLKMLGRLKVHMANHMAHAASNQPTTPFVELAPPPPFQQQEPSALDLVDTSPQEQVMPSIQENDRLVPSINGHRESDAAEVSSTGHIDGFETIGHNNPVQSSHSYNQQSVNNEQSSLISQTTETEIDEIELSSDEDGDQAEATSTTLHRPVANEAPDSSSSTDDQDESSGTSEDRMEINESSVLPTMVASTAENESAPAEASNSEGGYAYENISSSSISNNSLSIQSDTRLSAEERPTTSVNGLSAPLHHQFSASLGQASVSESGSYVTLDSEPPQPISSPMDHPIPSESAAVTTQLITGDDDEAARMDADQLPESVPVVMGEVATPNDNAVFVVDEFVPSTTTAGIHPGRNLDEQSVVSNSTTTQDMEASSEIHDQDEQASSSTTKKTSRGRSRTTVKSTSHGFRNSIKNVLNILRNAKYGNAFARPLRSFKLPDEYFLQIKNPLDIPLIRERMNNGDYDENILLFERDVLLMFTNALCMYRREDEIHDHAKFMLNYATELFLPIPEVSTPWKPTNNIVNIQPDEEDDGDTSSVFRVDNEDESDDNTFRASSSTRTRSTTSTSSSKSVRRQLMTNAIGHSSAAKRQRKTTH